ncbi:MAG: RluA family pseudouridine synthase [Clostridia bacterium]|nr:RluA family pseudouridine synthase [Clostridia bacterium]
MEIIEKLYEETKPLRVDVFAANETDISRSRIASLIETGNITVNDKSIKKNAKLQKGDRIKIILPDPEVYDIKAENIPLDILYEDDDLLVVNKPKGMVVHPAAGNFDGTLVNALMYHCKDSLSGINGVMRPGIVHRIDKNTSGLLMVAKNDVAHISLAQQIKEHSFTREYIAIAYGNFKDDSGTVNAPIERHPVNRKQMAIVKGGREAVTHYEVVERFGGFTYLKLRLETGRTHQIRVHMASLGHPIAGDDVYGPKKVITKLCGQCLHARKIGFIHPKTNEYMEFESEIPDYFNEFLMRLRHNGKV